MARKRPFDGDSPDNLVIDPQELQETIEKRARQLADAPEFTEQFTEDEDTDELRALAEIDGASECTFSVTRVLPVTEKGYVGSLAASEVTMERIAEFGKGRYKIRGVRANGQFAGQRTVDIAAPPKKPEAQPAHVNPLQEYLALQDAKNAERREEMKQWAMILAPVVTAVLPAVFGNRSNAQVPTLTEMTQMMLNLKAMNPEPKSATSQIQDLAAMVNVIKEMQGDKEPVGSSWADIARDGIKEIGPLVGAVVAARAGVPAPVPVVAQTEKPQPQIGDPMMQLLNWFRAQLEMLATQAAKNKNPELYAEVLLDNIPAGVDPKMILKYLTAPNWWQQLQSFVPAVSSYPQWFAECRAILVEQLSEMIRSVEPAAPSPMPAADNDA